MATNMQAPMHETGDPPAHVPPAPVADYRPTNWGMAILIATILFVAGSLRLILTPLQEAARAELHFTDLQMSTLQGMANGLPVMLFSIPIGLAIDHMNRARLFLLMALIWVAGAFWTAFATSFAGLFMARSLVALGAGIAIAPALSMISDICMPQRRGRVLLLAGVGPWVGVAFAFAMGGKLFGYFAHPGTALVAGLSPWRQASLIFAIMGAVMLIPIALMREPKRYEREQHGNAVMPALRAFWARRSFLMPLFLGQMVGGLGEGASGVWAAPVLERYYGLKPDQFGGWMGAMLLISGVFGSIIGGVVADWGSKAKIRGGILIGAIVATICAAPASAYPMMPTVLGFGIAFGVMLFGCTVSQLVGATAVSVLLPNEERGIAMSVLGVVGTLIGLGVSPFVTLLGVWIFGDERHLPESLAIIGVVTGALALVGYVIAMLNAPERKPA